MIITFDNGLKIRDIMEITITPPYIDYEDHNSEMRYKVQKQCYSKCSFRNT